MFAKSLVLTRAIPLALLFGQNSSASEFIVCYWPDAVILHDSPNVCSCCIARTRYDFQAINRTALTLRSRPEYTSVVSFINFYFK